MESGEVGKIKKNRGIIQGYKISPTHVNKIKVINESTRKLEIKQPVTPMSFGLLANI